jgi:hypothetical protein
MTTFLKAGTRRTADVIQKAMGKCSSRNLRFLDDAVSRRDSALSSLPRFFTFLLISVSANPKMSFSG